MREGVGMRKLLFAESGTSIAVGVCREEVNVQAAEAMVSFSLVGGGVVKEC
jgi:hypothetical protein